MSMQTDFVDSRFSFKHSVEINSREKSLMRKFNTAAITGREGGRRKEGGRREEEPMSKVQLFT